jgi:hypothetical protein
MHAETKNVITAIVRRMPGTDCALFSLKKKDRRDLDNNAGDSDKVDKIVLISRS